MTDIPMDDVVEACADALLSAVAAQIILGGREPTMAACMARAHHAVEWIGQRTLTEGAKPRHPEAP